jgi:hypothetical protein
LLFAFFKYYLPPDRKPGTIVLLAAAEEVAVPEIE